MQSGMSIISNILQRITALSVTSIHYYVAASHNDIYVHDSDYPGTLSTMCALCDRT